MTDALNHLSAFNRIATALENLPEDDLTALVEAITAIANKTIPVADMGPVATAITNKVIPVTNVDALAVKLDTLNTTLANLSIGGSGGGSSTGGGLDCDCLADAIGKLADKIDQIVCVIVPIANSQHQIEKAITYIMRDGPQFGIDAPPGTFIFPVPGDSAPSLPYTPNPTPTPIDSTGGWTAPPIIEGVYYVDPPGGMQGSTDLAAYDDYKCNVANFIFDYLLAWMNWLDAKAETIDVGMMIGDAVIWVITAIRFLMALHGLLAAATATGGVSLIKVGAAVGAVVLSGARMIIITGILIALQLELYFASRTVSDWITVLNAAKGAIICALWKAKTPSAAREAVMTAITNHYTLYYSFLPDFIKEGTMGRLTRLILSDNLLANLFARQEGWPEENFGTASTPCVECLICRDMDEAILVNQRSVFGYPQPLDIRTGLVPWPITINLGLIDSDVICMAARCEWINGGSLVNITQNGADLGNWSWGGWTDTGEGNASELATMPFKETLFLPKGPATRFTGNIVMKVYNEGATWKTKYEVESVGWRLPE